MAEQVRVHTLAKSLNVTSKDIIEKCRAEGITIKNHMSTLSAGLEATVREWFSDGAHETTVETSKRVDLEGARKRRKAIQRKRSSKDESVASSDTATAVADAPPDAEIEDGTDTDARSVAATMITDDEVPVDTTVVAESPAVTAVTADSVATVEPLESIAAEQVPVVPGDSLPALTDAPPVAATDAPIEDAPIEDAPALAAEPVGEEPPVESDESIAPAGPQNVPLPAKVAGPRVVRYEAVDDYTPPRRGPRRPAGSSGDVAARGPQPAGDAPPEAGDGKGGARRGTRRRVVQDERGPSRRGGRRSRGADVFVDTSGEIGDQDLAERQARLRGATGRRMVSRRAVGRKGGSSAPSQPTEITVAQVEEPITLKQLCSALGVPFQRMFPVLAREHNLVLNLTSIIDKSIAELIAVHFGVELTVVEKKTGLDQLRDEHAARDRGHLARRAPIVTVLGHVDHGKTSLLDRIRLARVAEREDGGITQHISSYHYEKDDVAVTFLDTPGHEAFTALRARGAQLTDVVVLVVAADDGVMPQTVEAINHAKAAKVPIVVALNKIDLGRQNVTKIYGELTEQGLTPSGDWGGEIDVVETSATTGEGVDSLLEYLSTLADLHEYEADETIPATGTVIEAESRQGVGTVLQTIVREGTVRVGDVLVAGNCFGKVRALKDDRGRSIDSAGPSMPVEIWGMNEVPSSGDHFFQVDTTQRAKEIAEEIKQRRETDARASIKKARSLDDLVKQHSGADVPELNVIVKGDVDGSVDVLASTLGQFPDDEVRLNLLHAGIGAVTDSDVHLADASNAIIIAFRVVAPSVTRRLAEEKGVDIRHYKVIYDVTDDIRKALEGLLTPDEVIEQRGVVEVREVFRISKVGLVAGCYVKEGTAASSHKARVVRDGKVVRDRCAFDSLRRFKDDVKEVRSGMECGIRLVGFDDLKIADQIETFEVIHVARKLGG